MSALLGIASLLGLLVGIIGVVVCLFKKKSMKKSLITLATSFIIFLVAVNIPGETVTPTAVVPATSTEVAAETTVEETTVPPVIEEKTEENVPTEYISALAKAETYGAMMNMSKAGIYDQLISENGEKFSKESAQYAVDNVNIDYNANALKKAQTYQKEMSMSPSAVYDQLISEHGEKFTAKEAQYAKDNLK